MIKKGLYAILAIVLIMEFSFHVYNALAGVDCYLSARTGWKLGRCFGKCLNVRP